MALTGWNKLVGKDFPDSSCDNVSLNTTATYRSNSFPTCKIQNAPVLIRYTKNLVKGYADKSAEIDFTTIKAGPKVLCTNLLEENNEFYVEERQLIVDGEIGCQGRPPALFFNDLKLNEGDIHTSASGNDYNGTPLFFDVDGSFQSNYIDFDIAIYGDSAHTQHVRTDHCSGDWDGNNFYDGSCSLVQDTSAGCVPIWTRLIKDNDQNPGSQQLSPQNEYDDYSTETLMRR